MVQAQKDAISKIRSALSDEKRKKFDALVDPMKKGDGTILQIKGRMFEVNER